MSKRKVLKESLYDYKDYIEDMTKMILHCIQFYPEQEYAELGVLLGYLRSLGIVHQSHHWQTLGKNYYGDHLLYERLYNDIVKEADLLAEKIVGVGDARLTNYFAQLENMKCFLNGVSKGEELSVESYRAELMFLVAGELITELLERKGILTRGLEQSLGNILDKHEEHVYLLKQRTNETKFIKDK